MSVLGEVEGVAGAADGGLDVARELQSEDIQCYGLHGLSISVPACWGYRGSAATCGVCTKPPIARHAWALVA